MRKGETAHNKGKQKADYPFGMYGSPTYVSWNTMKTRCTSKANPKFVKNYQNRGISYDPRWEKFSCFLQDMGVRPEGKTLERLNNDKGYSKENCVWASPSHQNRNRRTHSNTGIKHVTKWKGRFIVHVHPFKKFTFSLLEQAVRYKSELLSILK